MGKKEKFYDHLRQYLNLFLAISQVIVSFVLFKNGMDFGASTAEGFIDPPLVPAAYAFSIWGLIYLLTVLYALFQAQPKERKNKMLREIGPFTAVSFWGTSFWLILARYDLVWLSLICILIIFAASLTAYLDINAQKKLNNKEVYFVLIPVSIFAGWVTAASFVNIQATMSASGLSNWLIPEIIWSVIFLFSLCAVALYIINNTRYSIVYGLTIVWALLGIMIKNISPETYNPNLTVVTGVAALVIALNLLYKRTIALDVKK